MAFWGVEVKPGKPFTHKPADSNGRLHISMATLGLGAAEKRSRLQCNVGQKSPIYLCCLYPAKTECLQLHVEFDEADEVMFSVLGPRSVHLAGYYLGGRRPYNPDDSESFGQDIVDSETQGSVNSEDEEYDDSFINDGSPEVFPATPVSDATDSDSCSEEELLAKKRAKKKPHKGKVRHRRLRKTYQFSDSDGESEENDDNHTISSLLKAKSSNAEDAIKKGIEKIDTINTKAMDESIKNADNVLLDGQMKRKFEVPVDPYSNVELENGGKSKRKRKERLQEEKKHEANLLDIEDEPQKMEANAQNRSHNRNARAMLRTYATSLPLPPLGGERLRTGVCPLPFTVGHDSDKFGDEPNENKVKKKKKKRSKTHSHGETVNEDLAILSTEENIRSPVKNQPNNVNAKLSEDRTGFRIEDLDAGELDGKVATSGKKVTVQYVGKLKENGGVVDSSEGGAPLKFRLGRGRVIEGLATGINGMRVGGKRRIFIPPSMAYGSEGDGKGIPPDSWLIYEVDLVKVKDYFI